MTQERFEWLEIPDEATKPKPKKDKTPEAVVGKRCPQCGWLDEETATHCFRCGYRYNLDYAMADRIAELGVTLPPRVLETEQNLENFFRIHGRARLPEALSIYQLRMQAELLRLSKGFDQLVCLEEIAVEHYEHQIETAIRALRDMRGRALLADEVGLGKTIEAGIIMKELIQRGLVRSVLVLTPAAAAGAVMWCSLIKFHLRGRYDYWVECRSCLTPDAGACYYFCGRNVFFDPRLLSDQTCRAGVRCVMFV